MLKELLEQRFNKVYTNQNEMKVDLDILINEMEDKKKGNSIRKFVDKMFDEYDGKDLDNNVSFMLQLGGLL